MKTGVPASIDSSFPRGANSSLDSRLPAGYYVRAENTIIRGGIAATRPGTLGRVAFPAGRLQGAAMFTPRIGFPEIVAVIDGTVYSSEYPFDEFSQIDGVRFSPQANTVFFEQAQQFAERNEDGSTKVITLKNVLMMQDGESGCGYYDGYAAGNVTGVDKTPQGTTMKWVANRLWVATNDRVRASDIGNPFSFVEQYYLGGTDALLFQGPVTAMAVSPSVDTAFLIVFTEGTTSFVQASIPREQWLTTDKFQFLALPHVGCISHLGVVAQSGMLYWYGQNGLVSFDMAQQSRVSSVQMVMDNEMAFSKAHVRPQLHQIALAAHDNHVLVSVPYGSEQNTHTWVLDLAAIQNVTGETNGNAWASVWTGFTPSHWIDYLDSGTHYQLAVCGNQVVEFFRDERTDSGVPIQSVIELRTHTADSPLLRQIEFAYLTVSDLAGIVDISVDWRGFARGRYKRCLTRRLRAAIGSFRPDNLIEPDSTIFALKKQSRRLRTEQLGEDVDEVPGSSKDIEAALVERWDWGFQFRISWCGEAAIRSFEVVVSQPPKEANVGECVEDETTDRFVNFDGYAGTSIGAVEAFPVQYAAAASATAAWAGVSVTGSGSGTSPISQQAAQHVADAKAQSDAARKLFLAAPPTYGILDLGTE